jgi:hypothetical protein
MVKHVPERNLLPGRTGLKWIAIVCALVALAGIGRYVQCQFSILGGSTSCESPSGAYRAKASGLSATAYWGGKRHWTEIDVVRQGLDGGTTLWAGVIEHTGGPLDWRNAGNIAWSDEETMVTFACKRHGNDDAFVLRVRLKDARVLAPTTRPIADSTLSSEASKAKITENDYERLLEVQEADRNEISKGLEGLIGQLSSEEDLKKVFHFLEERQESPAAAGLKGPGELYGYAALGVGWRLGNLRTQAAADVLTGLLCDESLVWDGEGALTIGTAITRCGTRCLPGLSGVPAEHPQKRFAEDLAQYIIQGKEFGP